MADVRDVAATSKPRGNYLDPLKACALSGENGVPAGKSESATFSKYNSIIKQSRRNASRASVLNDVERSRFESIVKRMENEHVYHTAVLDRQKRQFRKSLEVLEKDRRAVKRYFDRGGNWVATPLKLVDGFPMKRNRLHGEPNEHLPSILDAVEAVHVANSEQKGHRGNADGATASNKNAGKRTGPRVGWEDDEHIGHLPNILRRNQTMPAGSQPKADSITKPPERFYTGDDMNSMKERLKSQESGHDNPQTATKKDLSHSI